MNRKPLRMVNVFDPNIVTRTNLADVPFLLSKYHPHLSKAQHNERLIAAAHEASHLLVALLSGTTNIGTQAYIRVPGRASKYGGKRGVRASVPIGNLDSHKADMMVSLAGSLFSGMVEPDNELAGSVDLVDYRNRLEEYATDNGMSFECAEETFGQQIINETAACLIKYWSTIDWIATALLLSCTVNGDLKLLPIVDYFYRDRQRLIISKRSNYFVIPKKHLDYVAARKEFTIPAEM